MIQSVKNNKVIYLSKLCKRNVRYKHNEYIIYGKTLVDEAIKNDVVLEVFTTEKNEYKYTLVSEEVMTKIVGEANTKYAALCEMKSHKFDSGSALVIDNIQDPGNLGTMIRSAKAFGISNVFLGCGTVDLYNPKVLRSMQGVNYYMNIQTGEIEHYLNNSNNQLITTYLDEKTCEFTALDKSSAFDIMFGNEGSGLDAKYKMYKRHNIVLDIEYESLNVAIAAGIIMHKLKEIR